MIQRIRIELPFPPSVNSYWGSRIVTSRKTRRAAVQRYVDEPGKRFRRAAIDECMVQRVMHRGLQGPLAAAVDYYPPDARTRDHDNFGKGLWDALVHAGVMEDDSQIRDCRYRMHPKQPPGKVIVTLWPISDMQCAHAQMDLAG